MAKYTENIRLAQPEGSDYYDIEVFNHNSELIDKKIGEMDNSLSTIKEGATREKAGIVQLGTEEGKALEGMMLARLAGCIGYGGDIQDDIVKNPNYIYYDKNTRKMYKCLKQNQDISANVANFIPLDNNSLLERLENLFKVENKDVTSRVTNCKNAVLKKIKLDRLCIMQFTITSEATASINNKCTIYFDEPFKDIPFISVTDNNTGASGATSPSIDWPTISQITVSNFEGAFTLMAIGYI
ncbi:hypothetical protein [Fusobacterium vincentii]|uniref:hypothetical protein n=1 Tax=Fusobacterium vincentii TaxID=155615 RepID=UPI0030D2E8C7